MAYHRRRSQATPAQSAQTFMCFALHNLPSEELLSQCTKPWQIGNYTFRVLNGKRNATVAAGDTCIIRLSRSVVEIMPLPSAIHNDNAPYAIAYDFYLRSAIAEKTQDSNGVAIYYNTVANYYGFTIATLPEHDWRRACSAMALHQRENALLHADRAIVALAEHLGITDQQEKIYGRYLKLMNLYIDQPDQPEGLLAFERCWSTVQKLFTSYQKDSN
jgi:hypothetical protein